MTPPDNNPSNRPPSLYQMTAKPERKGGGGGMVALALVVLVLLAGGAYYFLKMRKQPVVAASLPAAATPAPRAVPAPSVGYNSVTEQGYIDQADDAFKAVQQPKIKTFNAAFAALKDANFMSAKDLTSKEAVAARRDLIAKCIAADNDYIEFLKTQEATYKDDLAKTPLTPADAKETFEGYVAKAKTPDAVKLRQAQVDYFKSGDDMMAALEKWYGSWSITPAGKLSFKRREKR